LQRKPIQGGDHSGSENGTTRRGPTGFMKGETFSDYEWALLKLKYLHNKFWIPGPQVLFIDRDLALLNALEAVFPAICVLFC
jgi:hypothetical protein